MKIGNMLKILTWADVEQEVIAKNPMIGNAIKMIKGVDKFKVIKATYRFGDDIIEKGQFKLNFNNKNLPYNDAVFPKEIHSILNYNWKAIPFGIVLKNTTESYINHSSHIVPFRLMPPGTTFSVVSVFDPSEFSNTVAELRSTKAGCRSLILLPKISHAESNQRLAKLYDINKKYLCPKKLADQWRLFYEIVNSKSFNGSWTAEILLFSKEFISQSEETLKLRYDLLYRVWQMDSFRRNQVTHDFIWSMFLKKLPIRLKNDPFVIETVKHIVLIAMQEVPGYIPACDDLSAPIHDFTKILLENYRIRFLQPIFMRLEHYDGINPIYYSLHRQTFFYDLPNKPPMLQTIVQLERIREVLFMFRTYILQNKFEHPLDKTFLYKTFLTVDFDFYHPKGGKQIKNNTIEIAKEDKRFALLAKQIGSNLEFPEHSIFFHGCIRLRPKK